MSLPEHLMVCSDGHLYDTRRPSWPEKPIRKDYQGYYRCVTLAQVKAALREGPYTSVGGYPVYFTTRDGEALAFDTVRENWREVVSAMSDSSDNAWHIAGVHINYEDAELCDAHTGKPIPAAYTED